METKISFYKSSLDKKGKDISMIDFLRGIKDGTWQDHVFTVRLEKDKSKRSEIKRKAAGATISGSFESRKDAGLRKHSGFITMDIDDLEDVHATKRQLINDPYIYAGFESISGGGLCLIFIIDGERHLDAFEGIAKYLYDTYQLIVDQSCKNVSRLRYVSYDPQIHIKEDAVIFKKYLPKPKKQKQNKVVYVEDDLDRIIKDMYDRGVNICEDYRDWISVCYAIASEFGDTNKGLDHFHTLSSMSSKYNKQDTDKQYKSCLRTMSDKKLKQSSISTIYHFAKINGIEVYSKQTKDVIRAAASQYKNGVNRDTISSNLKKFNDIPEDQSKPIIDQVIEKGIEHESENIIEDILHFLQTYGLRKNLITRNVEMNGKPLDDSDINTLFIDCKSMFDKVTKDLICSVIYSNKIEQYNPMKDFFNEEVDVDTQLPNLKKLIGSLKSDTVNYDKWVTKWLVSCVASVYGTYSPLVLVFSGEVQGTGKTHAFRYLLPKKLRSLFAESKMDNGKDDEILMTKKLIILDDEYGGKSKREEKKLKEITAKEFINVREPYGRVSVDLRRLAVFCGTSNDTQIISDPTGNRRIMPVHILEIDQSMYNSCDKEMLWHELKHLYDSGYDHTVLKSEITNLNESTEMFNASTPEEELIAVKFTIPSNSLSGEWLTITEIINIMVADTKFNMMNNTRVGMLLSKNGYEKKRMRKNGIPATVYYVEIVTDSNIAKEDDAPF